LRAARPPLAPTRQKAGFPQFHEKNFPGHGGFSAAVRLDQLTAWFVTVGVAEKSQLPVIGTKYTPMHKAACRDVTIL
jgi:hypothetical protein